ncbi:peptidyl-prolyl cis-trans isomerase D [Candidatus Phycosocius bacilliformis]|uniref:Peptidyl-prolyl cis-trans isomerase D n=1 Tax=Candidatus Phycosocius bacilliformis TaxID=1445552 RepID=A0A2P2E893_9PROT|nr:peptidylprolyl isomerase [Candidatus Phycosocius bacilliformis]GBF57267.1 peptidyl-prolyl cis-trans isomerase D [Candidatus Phycosocius bacilliformis]
MLTAFRKFARSWVSAIIIGLLVISFGIWGVSDVFTRGPSDAVARVAGESISQNEYRAEFDRLLKRAKEEAKRDVTTEEARAQGFDSNVLEQLVAGKAFEAFTTSLGLRAPDALVKSEIAKIPAFQDQFTRRFSQTSYEAALRENGFTSTEFENRVRADISRQYLTLAVSSGLRAPKVYASQTLAFGTERRMVTIVPIPASLVGGPRQPNDAQLKALYEESRAQLTQPETRDLTMVLTSLTDFEAKVKVDEAQARQIFESNKARLSKPAKRGLIQLVSSDRAKADQAATRLRAGEDPAAIAKALGLTLPVILSNVTIDGIPDQNVGKAAFAMNKGDVQVVAAKLQPFAAIKVTDAVEAKEARFEENSAEIFTQLRQTAAGELITDATEAYDEAISSGASMEAAATKAGFKLVQIKGVTAQGTVAANGQPVAELADAPSLLKDAFSGGKGDMTDLVSIPKDRYAAVRVDAVTPAAPPALESIRAELTAEWIRRDIRKRAEDKAREVMTEAGKSGLEAAAAKFNLPVARQPQPLQRGQGGPQLSQAVFSAKKGAIVMAPTANGVEYSIVRIDEVLKDNEAQVPDRLIQAENAVRSSVQRDLVASIERVARDRAKVQLFPKMMGRALGDTAETDAAKAGSAAKKQ